jgi:rod shape-determining protein MreD
MIMPRGQELLLPASPWFIWATLIGNLFLNMILAMWADAPSAWVPDLLCVVLAFWTIHQPRFVGMAIAFGFGIAMDIHHTSLLGQHALSYTWVGFCAIMIHRRLLWFPLMQQAAQVFPLFVLSHASSLVVQLLAGHHWPGWGLLLAPCIEALLWPIVSILLLAPQRRAHDPDLDRPI